MSAPVEPPVRSPSSTARTAGWITVAAGGVFAVGGIVLGAVALQKRSSLDESCVDRRCPDRSQSDIDSMYATGRASTALFLVGGVALGAGAAVLLSTSPSNAAVVSPGGVAFRRTF